MDCKHISENDVHEKYLFDDLSAQDKKAYEQHLSECPVCTQELEKEKILITGVRTAGKEEMKNEIRQQAKEIKAQKQPMDWQMMLKVAAVVFIIALIPGVIYFFQTDSGEPLSPFAAEEQILSDEDNSFASEPSAKQEQSPGKSGESIESKEFADKVEQRQKQPMPAMPLADRSISEAEMESMAIGKGALPAETSIAAILEDSITKTEMPEMPETLPAESKVRQWAAEIDTNQVFQDIANGTKYYYAQLDKKMPPFDAGEIKALQKLDEVAARQFSPSTGRQAGETGLEESPTRTSALYKADNKKIMVYFQPPDYEYRIDQDSRLAQSFNVQIIHPDSLDWKMVWQVNPGFLDYDPSRMELIIKDQSMYLIIPEGYIYRIDLNSDSTRAVLVKK